MTLARRESGQAVVIVVLLLAVLLGMAAAVLDVGSWFRAQRAAQATADAAALAAAQELPANTGKATSVANTYAGKNGGGLAPGGVTFSTKWVVNDTISVRVARSVPGFFAKMFGLKSVQVSARATARSYNVAEARWVAPIVVHYRHSLLNCTRGGNPVCNPNFGATTTLTLEDLHKPGGGSGAGAFGLINLNQSDPNGNIGANVLADWLMSGYEEAMPLGQYYSAPSANFNNSQFLSALDYVTGKEVLFPVYRLLTGPGANAKYDIIGWVGFVITSYSVSGSAGTLNGYFTRYIAEGITAEPNGSAAGLGVQIIELVE